MMIPAALSPLLLSFPRKDYQLTLIYSLEFTEEVIPDNGLCPDAVLLQNRDTVEGTVRGSETLAGELPSCALPDGNDSGAVFYRYVTEFNYGDLSIDTCLLGFDTIITVFTGDCAGGDLTGLVCETSADDGCEIDTRTRLVVPEDQRFPIGTELIIAVYGHSSTTNDGEFFLTLNEIGNETPDNSGCATAIPMSTGVTYPGTTLGSSTLSDSLPVCAVFFHFGATTVFYTYTSTLDNSRIIFDTCYTQSNVANLRVYTGDCNSELECVGTVTSSCEIEIDSLPAGTSFVIALSGNEVSGPFYNIRVQESSICSPDGPEYECATSFSVVSDRLCDDGVSQCGVIPSYSLGFCHDLPDCDCTITKESGPEPGAVVSGLQEIVSIATNTMGFSSDECSFRISTLDKCNPAGPELTCVSNVVNLQTRRSCRRQW